MCAAMDTQKCHLHSDFTTKEPSTTKNEQFVFNHSCAKVSLMGNLDPEEHLKMGATLKKLTEEEDAILVCSGQVGTVQCCACLTVFFEWCCVCARVCVCRVT